MITPIAIIWNMPQIVIKIEQFEIQSEILKFINRKGSHYTYITEFDNKKLKDKITNLKKLQTT